MMPCSDIRAGLDDWLDGLLDESTREVIEVHLAECPACAEFFARQRRLHQDLHALSHIADRIASTVPAVSRRKQAATQRVVRTQRTWIQILLPVVSWSAAAVLVLAIGLGGYYASVRERGPHPLPGPLADNTPVPPPAQPEQVVAVSVLVGQLAVPMESTDPRIHVYWVYQETGFAEDSASTNDATKPNPTPEQGESP
jgi:anti-sigma factor RsiW